MKTNENALVLKYSSDKQKLLTSDNKVFAVKENGSPTFSYVTHPNSVSFADDSKGKVCIKVSVCIGEDANGVCKGWKIEVVCELPSGN